MKDVSAGWHTIAEANRPEVTGRRERFDAKVADDQHLMLVVNDPEADKVMAEDQRSTWRALFTWESP